MEVDIDVEFELLMLCNLYNSTSLLCDYLMFLDFVFGVIEN